MQNIAKRNSTEVTDVTAETARVFKVTLFFYTYERYILPKYKKLQCS